jgi:hypothetical protein
VPDEDEALRPVLLPALLLVAPPRAELLFAEPLVPDLLFADVLFAELLFAELLFAVPLVRFRADPLLAPLLLDPFAPLDERLDLDERDDDVFELLDAPLRFEALAPEAPERVLRRAADLPCWMGSASAMFSPIS